MACASADCRLDCSRRSHRPRASEAELLAVGVGRGPEAVDGVGELVRATAECSEARHEVSEPRTLCFPTTVKLALDCKRAFGAINIFIIFCF